VFLDVAGVLADDDAYKDIRFFVVGDGPMKDIVDKRAAALPNVTNFGYRTDIGAILSMSDIFILPSSIEGFPLSILEALSMENVCIASAVGAVPDIIEEGKTGFVVAHGNVNEIVDSLFYLHKNRKELKQMQKKARDIVVNHYSNEQLGKNYRALYREVLK
jgi:glycosyltransferase involved in cell wall biosynthesis